MITIEIAGLSVALDNKYTYVERLCADYISDDEPLFTVSATEADVEREGQASDVEYPPAYLESIVLYRKIAEKLPLYDAFVFHGAVLVYDGVAYAFTARSGVGKTTHTRLWLSEFSDKAYYLNGDKPIIRFFDGVPYACGTPYKGKEGYGVNERVPLGAIAFVNRAAENRAERATKEASSVRLLSQIFLPKEPSTALATMSLADRLLDSVKLVDLYVNMEKDAAHVAMKAMTDAER